MYLLASLIPILLLGGMFYLLYITLREAFKLKGGEQIAWVCLIILVFPIGSIIFLLAKPGDKR
jgi:preprotein translocase subunit YajC